MKRTILMLIIVALATTLSFSQTDSIPQLITVKDTSYANDERLNFMVNTILPATTKFFEEYNARTKVSGGVLTKQVETNTLLQQLNSLVYAYAQNFIQVNDIQVDPNSIVSEFNSLNERINTLQSDPDIKYLEAMREFQAIQERQAKLAKYYEQINDNPPTPTIKAWLQPTGAHDAYNKGAKVTHNGKTWKSTLDANVWAPGVGGWREI